MSKGHSSNSQIEHGALNFLPVPPALFFEPSQLVRSLLEPPPPAFVCRIEAERNYFHQSSCSHAHILPGILFPGTKRIHMPPDALPTLHLSSREAYEKPASDWRRLISFAENYYDSSGPGI
jgi:hypothetical protein